MDAPIDMTPEEFAASLIEIKKVYGAWGICHLRVGADYYQEKERTVHTCRPLAEATESDRSGMVARCIFCSRDWRAATPEESEKALRASHVDQSGMKNRGADKKRGVPKGENHVICFVAESGEIFSLGKRMDE